MISKAHEPPRPELEKINLLINRRFGLEFRHQRLKRLQEAVQARMKACKVPTVGDYLQFLEQQPEEVLHLINLLTVHETYFFREPTQFTIMSRQLIPRLLKTGGHPFLRLLSAGCSTGEEAYSLAIAALKIPGAGIDWDFEVIGVDIDKTAIQKAQAGVYGLYSFRSCPKDIREKFFTRLSKDQFAIKHQVKEKVRFESLNLFEQVYPDWTQNMDIVFYRNVSIYFSKEQRKALFQRLSRLLKSDGCLFLSCTETLYHNNKQISLVKNGEVFYYQKQTTDALTGLVSANAIPAVNHPATVTGQARQTHYLSVKRRALKPAPRKVRSSAAITERLPVADKSNLCQRMFATALELVKIKNYAEAINCLNEIIALDSLFIKAFTLKANVLLNQGQAATATDLCQAALVMDPFCLEAYLLLGMAAKLTGQITEAMRHFKAAIYAAPECWLAHFYLAEVYQSREEADYAKREYEVAIKILKQGNFEKHGLSLFLLPFQHTDFIRLCRHNLVKLQNQGNNRPY